MKILIVEDDKKIAKFIVRALEQEKYEIEVVHDGERGYERILGKPVGSPIKGCLTRAKTFPMQKKDSFFVINSQLSRSVPLPQFLYDYQCQPLLHQSPIRIQAVRCRKVGPFRS